MGGPNVPNFGNAASASVTSCFADGIALMSILTGRAADGAYRGLAAMLLAYAAHSFQSGAKSVPVERMRELLGPQPQ